MGIRSDALRLINLGIRPTGYRTLMRLLGDPDPQAFQQRWERYVLGLSFP